MTNERKEQIRKECEAEARDIMIPFVTNVRWKNEEVIGWITQIKSEERIKAEELIEALKECKAVLTMHTSISTRRPTQQEYESAMNTAFDALAKYRTP